MNTKARIILIAALVLLAGAALVAVTWAAPGNAPLAPGGSPTVVAYQGEVQVGGSPLHRQWLLQIRRGQRGRHHHLLVERWDRYGGR